MSQREEFKERLELLIYLLDECNSVWHAFRVLESWNEVKINRAGKGTQRG